MATLTSAGTTKHGRFGYSVALGADGSTALIGASNDKDYKGVACIYTAASPAS